jgi:uncharacterized protein involved in tolerance to divalent cations
MGGEANDPLVVYVTAPEAEAPRIARALVERGVAACVNIVPGLRSLYRWEGKIADDPESLLIAKTTRACFDRLRQAVLEVHPYQVPEVIALPVVAWSDPYAAWLRDAVGKEGP